ncbi:MAG: hypothetical protein FJ035_10255, partial [Chloroflexi bacterium]|nr:hypothetical protein [Chloroflexota bacterium]
MSRIANQRTHHTVQALEACLDVDSAALLAAAIAATDAAALPLYLVGGAVRDLVADRAVRDLDASTPGD